MFLVSISCSGKEERQKGDGLDRCIANVVSRTLFDGLSFLPDCVQRHGNLRAQPYRATARHGSLNRPAKIRG